MTDQNQQRNNVSADLSSQSLDSTQTDHTTARQNSDNNVYDGEFLLPDEIEEERNELDGERQMDLELEENEDQQDITSAHMKRLFVICARFGITPIAVIQLIYYLNFLFVISVGIRRMYFRFVDLFYEVKIDQLWLNLIYPVMVSRMSSMHTKFREYDSRRGTIRNALDEQTDYEQVRFRWLFGFIHVRHFFAMVQVVILYTFVPLLLLCGGNHSACPQNLFGNRNSPIIQTSLFCLAIFCIVCVVLSSVAFHWTEKLRYMTSSGYRDRFCQLSPMPFVSLFFVHQLFVFALGIFYLYDVLIDAKLRVFVDSTSLPTFISLLTGGLMPFFVFMILMIYIIYGDFRLWSYACFVREHTKLKRRLAKIDEERGDNRSIIGQAYGRGISFGNISRGSNRSLMDKIGSGSIRAQIQRYRQSLSRQSITTETNNSYLHQSLNRKPAHDHIDNAGDNPMNPHIISYASSGDGSMNESRNSRRLRPAISQSPPGTIRQPRTPGYTNAESSDVELMHVLDTIGEVNEDHST
ncbi:unnamed protein product [Bursaphelenchus okinawaensis]|uniref:Uncharacterized protein n=1 Tax=Bursaphelenchus okinawaensis TaxID=465554 RepID=A0A811JV03_9BILA|nr:unnamed protein product [Bursaphelenchus okinawaensis]CAG9084321.1 unnamed protein product [Bursaphelenchus okinawaensis]